jgi:hypothetical protein
MAEVMKSCEPDQFDEFVRLCEKAFNVVREHGHLIMTHFIAMLAAGLPELQNESDIHYLRDKLALEVGRVPPRTPTLAPHPPPHPPCTPPLAPHPPCTTYTSNVPRGMHHVGVCMFNPLPPLFPMFLQLDDDAAAAHFRTEVNNAEGSLSRLVDILAHNVRHN